MINKYFQNRIIDSLTIIAGAIPAVIGLNSLEQINTSQSYVSSQDVVLAYIAIFIGLLLVLLFSMHALFRIIKDAIDANENSEETKEVAEGDKEDIVNEEPEENPDNFRHNF